MTTPRDMRGGDAADRDAGDTNDELAGEDAKLRAMRSVWLSMREEEPSSGGLAELMAAARGKAAELAPRPTWWQRAAAGLRRPQALAFATVLVLLGGAMIVSRQVERDGARVAASNEARAPVVASGMAPPGVTAVARSQHDAEQGRPVAPRPAIAAPQAVAQARATAMPSEEPGSTARLEVSDNIAVDAKTATGAGEPSSRAPTAKPARVASEAPLRRVTRPADERDDDSVVAGTSAPETLSTGASTAAGDAAAPSPAPLRDDAKLKLVAPPHAAKPKPARPNATSPALYRQCAAAAARRDCTEVRRLVDQISTTDRAYRSQAKKPAGVAECLTE